MNQKNIVSGTGPPKPVLPPEAEAEIMDTLFKNLRISSGEIAAILAKHEVCGDVPALQDSYRKRLGQRLMASLRDESGQREVLAHGSEYVVVECCNDQQALRSINRRIQGQINGLDVSAVKVQSRIRVLDKLLVRFRKGGVSMGLRDMIRASREYPALSAKLESARAELQQTQQTLRKTQQALRQSTQDRGSLRLALEEQKDYTNFLDHKAKSLQEALVEFCPKLSTPEELKQFYDTISPGLDDQGFTLYHMARDLTGIDVPSLFPYEDNRGLFETMDGHQLMDWLTAVYFQAVDWEPIPGSTYESAALREVDTSTPEYLAFEKRLYGKVLERMGFDAVLAPEPEVSRTTELKLYSPLRAELVEKESVRDWTDEPEPPDTQILTGDVLSAPALRDAILKGIKEEQMPEEAERGLMLYYHGSNSVEEKVVSLFPTVEEVDGKLYGVAVCQVREQLTPDELAELKGFCTGQYADGWGEGYEQRPRKTEYGDLYVSFWQDKDFFILSKEEMAAARVPDYIPHRTEKDHNKYRRVEHER